MSLFQNKYRIESARLKKRDYSTTGHYFVTICTRQRRCIFGNITNRKMELNSSGQIIAAEWSKTLSLRSELKPDEFVIMPNHVHAIVCIAEKQTPDEKTEASLNFRSCLACHVATGKTANEIDQNDFPDPFYSSISPESKSLSVIIRAFKSGATRQMHLIGFKGNVWQDRFYDHIIRDQHELFAIRRYIKNNPANWENDRNIIESKDNQSGKQPWDVFMG